MKKIQWLLCFMAVYAGAAAEMLKGVVVDGNTSEPLIGAAVQVVGTAKGAVTNIDGVFCIDVPDGGAELRIKYVGYKETFVSGGALQRDSVIRLQPDNAVLEEVTVIARARQDIDATLLEQQKNSLSVQSGISSEQIKKTQDKDASEVIKRVPGISIVDDKFVMVRGLSQRYNSVWINGGAVPSSEADSRAFSFDIIPSAQLDNVVIVKSPSPEYPADFSGGFILVNTKNLPEKNSFSVSLGGNVNEHTHFQNFRAAKGGKTDWMGFDNGFRGLNGGIEGSLRPLGDGVDLTGNGFNNDWRTRNRKPWADLSFNAGVSRFWQLENGNKMGLIGALNYSNSYRTAENMVNSLFGAYDTEHDASNYLRNSVDNQYTQNVRLGVLLNMAYQTQDGKNRYEFKSILNQLGMDRYTERNGFNAQSDMERSAEYYYSSRTTYNGQLTGEHTVNDVNYVDWSAGYAYANKNMPDRKRYVLTDALNPGQVGLVTGNDINREYTFLAEHIMSASLDYRRDLTVGRIAPTLKAGGYGEYRMRDYRTRNFIYNWNPSGNRLPDGFRYMDMEDLLGNGDLYGADGLYLLEDVKWRNNYEGRNTLLSGYAAVNIPVDKFSVYVGVRFEHSRMELVSHTRDYEASPVSTFYDYNDFFPSVNATYRLNPKHQLRLAYGKSVNRPEFREVSASVFYDFDLASSVQGNPDLTACYVQNLDFRYEFYPSRGEQVSLAVFYKHFQDPIEWTYTVAGGTDLIYSYKNAKGAVSYGVELDVKKSLDFIGLPDFSLIFNGALIKSQVNFEPGDNEKDRPMQGQSPYLVNVGLFYGNDRLGLNASLLYNRIGKRLVGVGRSMGTSQEDRAEIPDSYEMPRNAVDLNVSKKFGKFELKLSVKDLLGESICFKQFDDVRLNSGATRKVEEITRKYTPGRNYSLSLSYSF